MGVLTYSQLNDPNFKEDIGGDKIVPTKSKQEVEKKVEKNKIEYSLFYPDNVAGQYYNGTYISEVNNERLELRIENGTIKTTDKDVRDHLEKDGFIYMYSTDLTKK